MQQIRHCIAREAQRTGQADLFGGACGSPRLPFKSASLTPYRFQIAVENDLKPFYFTEKLLDCLAAQTIPVYLGASRIADFFNPDGILPFTPDTPVERLLAQCTPAEYERRLPAVLDNYHRVLKYLNPDDRLYEEFFA
jgi:hypothetical protein